MTISSVSGALLIYARQAASTAHGVQPVVPAPLTPSFKPAATIADGADAHVRDMSGQIGQSLNRPDWRRTAMVALDMRTKPLITAIDRIRLGIF